MKKVLLSLFIAFFISGGMSLGAFAQIHPAKSDTVLHIADDNPCSQQDLQNGCFPIQDNSMCCCPNVGPCG